MIKKTTLIISLFSFNLIIFAQTGIVKTYFSKGKVESELSFSDDIWDGTSYWFYPNGNVRLEKTYSEGKLNGPVRSYYENGLIEEEYYVKNGVLDGLRRTFYENGGLKEVKTYKMGVLIKNSKVPFDKNFRAPVEAYSAGNRQYELRKKDESILCDVDLCPAPLGGLDDVYTKLKYPEQAKLYGLEGTVILTAQITTEGRAQDIRVLKALGLGCEEAAMSVLAETEFLPGQNNGKVVTSQITIKFPFKLDEQTKLAQLSRREKFDTEASIIKEEKDSPKVETVPDEALIEANNFSCNVDICPEPIGGMKELMSNLQIPLQAKNLRLNGDVVIIAEINEFGFVLKTEVIQSLGYGCDEAAESALYKTRFKAGMTNEKEVDAIVRVVIPFRLSSRK
ncbi:MAG: TonB family protein [Melioribacteraceae bacterium]|nr:TonB family protein [Melioribacteraceae bacterium]